MSGDRIWALGMMSGTSFDGVDAALIESDGADLGAVGPGAFRPYDEPERAVLRAAIADAVAASDAEAQTPGFADRFQAAARIVTDAHIEAARAAMALAPKAPALIGFHGQTVLHRPHLGVTVQLGEAARLAAALGAPVVYDFRAADVAAGGQGAPFAPFYHFALARRLGLRDAAFLNMGGVGNVTWIAPGAGDPAEPGAILAFDTGPANALIDDWMALRAGKPFDENGAAAAAGRADAGFVSSWIAATPYLAETPPKSLDRQAFQAVFDDLVARAPSIEDGAATLAAFSAATVAAAKPHLPAPPARWLVCGGGRRNPALMAALAHALGAPVEPIETAAAALGPDLGAARAGAGAPGFGDLLEAHAFGHLAVRSRRRLPLSAPGSTGAPHPIQGGRLAA